MEKETKTKTPKKAITIRLKPEIIKTLNEKLTEIYNKKDHRKQSTTIETLLNQFNQQKTGKLQEYLKEEKPLINLCNETIQEQNQTIQKLKNEIQEQKDIISTLTKKQSGLEQAEKEKYNKEIQTLKKEIQKQEKTIKTQTDLIQAKNNTNKDIKKSLTETYDERIKNLKKSVQDKEKSIQEKDKIIQDKDATIKTQTENITKLNKQVTTARNDYKHITETLDKLHNNYNTLQNENKEYAIAFAEIKKMSIIERITANYPKKFLQLTDGK